MFLAVSRKINEPFNMLRSGIARLLRPTVRVHRCISSSPWTANSKHERRPLANVDELFAKQRRPIEPLAEDPIIVKKFFVSEVDSEQMLYPEVISKDELDALLQRNQTVSDYIDKHIEFDGKGLSESAHNAFKQEKLFGYNIPRDFGGSGYTYTETLLASEAEARNINVAVILNAHRLVCEAVNGFGTDGQRQHYLPKLARGELIATSAFQEWNKTESMPNQTTAEFDADEQRWRLHGTKSFVVNAAKSNLFLVSAQVPQSAKSDSLTMFLVDAHLPGVSVRRKDDTLGHTNVYQADVSFDNVYLSPGL